MDAALWAKNVIERYGTNDVFEIAAKADVKIVYESWYPTTIGEFEPETKTIRVNRRALENNRNAAELEKIIVAHELGHFFAAEYLTQRRKDAENFNEERFAKEFAKALTTQNDDG